MHTIPYSAKFRGTNFLRIGENFAEIIFADYGFWLATPSLMQPPPRAIKPVVRADGHTRSCCDTVTLDLTTATAKGSLHVPGSLVQGNCTVHLYVIAASQLSWYTCYPRTVASLNAERFGCHSSQINMDTSFMCQRRYRVCAPCLRGGTIYC